MTSTTSFLFELLKHSNILNILDFALGLENSVVFESLKQLERFGVGFKQRSQIIKLVFESFKLFQRSGCGFKLW
jgi:hypothetical protein